MKILTLLALLVPILSGAVLLIVRPQNRAKRNRYVMLTVCVSAVFVRGTALASALNGPDAVYLHVADLSDKLVIAFRPDGVSLVFGCIIGVLWPVTTVYAFSYMEHEGRENMFFGFFLITFGVVAGIAYSANFFTLYLCYEFMTLVTLPLVMHEMNGIAKHAGLKYLLYSMGLKDAEELNDMITGVMTGEAVDTSISSNGVYDPQEFLGISFKLLPASRRFRYDKKLGVWLDRGDNEAVLNDLLDDAKDLVIAGVVMPDDEKALGIVQIGIDFLPEAMEELIAEAEKSPVVQAQLADPETDVLTGSPFGENTDDPFGGMADMIEIHPENMPDAVSVDLDRLPEVLDQYGRLSAQETVRVLRELRRTGESPTLKEAVEELIPALLSLFEIDEDKIGELISFEMDEARMQEMYAARASAGESSLKGNLTRFGYADPESPGMITIYPKDFESKDRVIEILESYNRAMEKEGQEDKVITYTDYVGSLMSSVTTIIDVITYVLIAFVAVSLVVSSIMIGIITYISVLERRKEIGILRAMGASRHNVSQVFNAETFIIGSLAGIFGIALTLLLLIPINAAIHSYTDEPVSAFLPPGAAGILIALCVVLNLIGGFIPARKAAKQDPVTALRSE